MTERSLKRGGNARRRALVTGASTGIGLAFARRLAHEKYDLVVVARNGERLDALAQELREREGVAVDPLPADLTNSTELRVVENVAASDERLELLVNNAGFGTAGEFAQLDPDHEEEEIRLNVVALVRLTHAALPGLLERGRGAIINVSSMAAFQPAPYNATYAATKAFVNSFSEALHEELRGSAVRVQALCPGFTRTEFQARAGIDAGRVPSFAWMTAEAVVDASLEGLRRGTLICVPGFANRVATGVLRAMPRSVLRRLGGPLAKQLLE